MLLRVWCVGLVDRGSRHESHKVFFSRDEAYLLAVAMTYDSGIEQVAMWEMTTTDEKGRGAKRWNPSS